jgi:RNA polymerase sigma-70 factor (sigma-E family)
MDRTETEHFDDAFDRLFRLAYRAAFRVLASREDAEDVAIEALARASARWRRLGPEPDGWVTTVAVNLALDTWRRRSRAARHSRLEGGDHPHPEPVGGDRVDLVRALASLPHRQRQAVVLRYFGDLTEDQTAEALGVSVGSVKQHTWRAMVRLRRELGE